MSSEQLKVVEAQEFRLVDKNGKRRASLGVDESGGNPCLTLSDTTGNTRVAIGIIDEASMPHVLLMDQNRGLRLNLSLTETGIPLLAFMGKEGNYRIVLRVNENDGFATLDLADVKGGQRIRLGVSDKVDGSPSLQLIDSEGKTRLSVGILEKTSMPNVVLTDQKGEPRLSLSVSDAGLPQLMLTDKDGNPRISLHIDDNTSKTILEFLDKNHRGRLTLLMSGEDSMLSFFDPRGKPRAAIVVTASGEPDIVINDQNGNPVWSTTVTE